MAVSGHYRIIVGFILFANFIGIVSGSAVFQNRSSFISYSIKREAGCVVAIGRFDLYAIDFYQICIAR